MNSTGSWMSEGLEGATEFANKRVQLLNLFSKWTILREDNPNVQAVPQGMPLPSALLMDADIDEEDAVLYAARKRLDEARRE